MDHWENQAVPAQMKCSEPAHFSLQRNSLLRSGASADLAMNTQWKPSSRSTPGRQERKDHSSYSMLLKSSSDNSVYIEDAEAQLTWLALSMALAKKHLIHIQDP